MQSITVSTYWRQFFRLVLVSTCYAATAVAGEYKDFVVDSVTGSLWITEEDSFSLLGNSLPPTEWRQDGSFVQHISPFAPFGARRGGFFSGLQAVPWGREVVIQADHDRFYFRLPNGRWEERSTKSLLPADVPCQRTLSAKEKGCALFLGSIDSRGLRTARPVGVDNIADAARSVQLFYMTTNGEFRRAEGSERLLQPATDSDDATYWFDAHNALVSIGTSGDLFTYIAVTPAGRVEHKVALPSGPASSMGSITMAVDADQVYLLQPIVDQRVGTTATVVYRIEDPLTPAAQLVKVAVLANISLSNSSDAFKFDDQTLYWVARGTLHSVDLTNQHVTELAPCDGGKSRTFLINGLQPAKSRLWAACGTALLELQDHHIRRKLQAAAPVIAGKILAADGDQVEIALQLEGDRFQHIRADGTSQVLDLSHGSSHAVLWPIWEEHGHVCGISEGPADRPARQVLCQLNTVWSERREAGPAPYETLHVQDKTWALAQDQGQTTLYNLSDVPDSSWQAVQSWPQDPSPPRQLQRPRLVRHGTQHVGVDLGTAAIWLWDGHQWVPSYSHVRSDLTLRPALDTEGNLYDYCPSAASNTARSLCVYDSAGGHKVVTQTATSNYYKIGTLLPLRQGILSGGNNGDYTSFIQPRVVRGDHAIDLGHLYGQFSLNGNKVKFITPKYLGDGSVLLETNNTSRQGLNQAYYRFDGRTLTPLTDQPSGGSKSSHLLFSSLSSSTRPKQGSEDPLIGDAWLSKGGIWHSTSIDPETPYAYGLSALDAAFGTMKQQPNRVNEAVLRGDLVWLAGDDGIYTCPLSQATQLSPDVAELSVTPGCHLRLLLRFAKHLRLVGGQMIAFQGGRIVLIEPGSAENGSEDQVTVLSEVGVISAFGTSSHQTVGKVSWTDDAHVQTLDLSSKTVATWDLPNGTAATTVKNLSPDWLCSTTGLYWRQDSAWMQVPALASCQAMAQTDGAILATDGQSAFVCTSGQCKAPIPVPETYLDDTVLGTLPSPSDTQAPAFAWVSGNHVYRLTDQGFTLDTPTYRPGPAILTKANSCEGGLIGLNGGGLIGRSGLGGRWWHMRLQ